MPAVGGVPEVNNKRIIVNVVLLIGVLMVIYYCVIPYLDKKSDKSDENYAPDRQRTDPQSDWNIVEEIRQIRSRQQKNITKMSARNYNI